MGSGLGCRGGAIRGAIRGAQVHGLATEQHDFEPGLAGGGMVIAAVADAVQAFGQDVPQVALGELGAVDGAGAPHSAVGAVFPTEGDLAFVDANDAAVCDDALPTSENNPPGTSQNGACRH